MESIVALDIETTGLDPEKDAIIEIGAVRFNDHRVEGEWSTLIHPGRRIPPFVTQLTGITDQMVLQAPPVQAVLPDLVKFVGDSPVLGHNVRFDLAFLRRQRVLTLNDTLDTYELASILRPSSERYNLGALAHALGVALPATHRALDDARVTRGVFLTLYHEALQLPIHILAEIVRMGETVEWGGYWPLRRALQERSREVVSTRPKRGGAVFGNLKACSSPPLQPSEDALPLDTDEVASILEQGGPFSRYFPHYEYRSQQVEMLRAVTDAFSQGRHLMVEAGTGTGKSMAYLIPAAMWAMHNKQRVVISTNTINLQDQLINKDIPDLANVLGLELRASVLKGRGNYLCPRRLESLRRRGPDTADEMRVLAKILVWLQTTTTGDRGEINLNGPVERSIWSRISAEDEGCTADNCLKRTGGNCPFYRARQAAQAAHILIVNHALLLVDVATGNRVLPEYDYVIIDEAHHIEDATTSALSFHVTAGDIDRILRELGGVKSGALGWLLSSTEDLLSPSLHASLDHMADTLADMAFRLDTQIKSFFEAIVHFLDEQRDGRAAGMYSIQERILPATRTQPAWTDVEFSWDECHRTLEPMLDIFRQLVESAAGFQENMEEEDQEVVNVLQNLFRRLAEIDENMHALVFQPAQEQVYWAESQANSFRVSLHAAPLHIGPLMEQYLWSEKASVILTSATLTTAGDFDYMRARLSAFDADELALGSPFDYENSALLYVTNDIPEPGDRQGHQRAVEQGLIRLCKATGGRTLVLFTSYDQLRRTSQAIAPILAKDDILVFEQGEGASPHSLLESFRTTERAVLLGTRAFWEGVDVPGQALSVLVIVKLPFDVPSDPIIAARSETFEDPFNQYALPEAILRFRQGFGRLIRSQLDHGMVVILDKRIVTKRYGRSFLDSLPTCTVRMGPLANLAQVAQQWLNL